MRYWSFTCNQLMKLQIDQTLWKLQTHNPIYYSDYNNLNYNLIAVVNLINPNIYLILLVLFNVYLLKICFYEIIKKII